MSRFIKLLIVGLFLLGTSQGASNSTKFVRHGSREVARNGVVVPSSATDLTTTDTDLYQITIANTTASACTFTLADKQTSAITHMSAVSIAANTTYVIAFPEGLYLKGGMTWSSGTATCLYATVSAYQK